MEQKEIDNIKKILKIIKALSCQGRLRVLALLYRKKGLCECEIREITGFSVPAVSRHLKVLENSGLIDYKKDGLWVNYSISERLDGNIQIILDKVLSELNESKLVRDDIKRLSRVKREDICTKKIVI
jgi:ArsR family transcriptional regulator, arsenate/arsenite/antimonite-responsive transcriptional repressor